MIVCVWLCVIVCMCDCAGVIVKRVIVWARNYVGWVGACACVHDMCGCVVVVM